MLIGLEACELLLLHTRLLWEQGNILCARPELSSQETLHCRIKDSVSTVWPSHLHLHTETLLDTVSGHHCLAMSKLVSHDAKSVSLLKDKGWGIFYCKMGVFLVAVYIGFQHIFIIIIVLHCRRWTLELEVSAAGKTSCTGAGQESWSYEQRACYFPAAIAFIFSDSALLFSSHPSDSHQG